MRSLELIAFRHSSCLLLFFFFSHQNSRSFQSVVGLRVHFARCLCLTVATRWGRIFQIYIPCELSQSMQISGPPPSLHHDQQHQVRSWPFFCFFSSVASNRLFRLVNSSSVHLAATSGTASKKRIFCVLLSFFAAVNLISRKQPRERVHREFDNLLAFDQANKQGHSLQSSSEEKAAAHLLSQGPTHEDEQTGALKRRAPSFSRTSLPMPVRARGGHTSQLPCSADELQRMRPSLVRTSSRGEWATSKQAH